MIFFKKQFIEKYTNYASMNEYIKLSIISSILIIIPTYLHWFVNNCK